MVLRFVLIELMHIIFCKIKALKVKIYSMGVYHCIHYQLF